MAIEYGTIKGGTVKAPDLSGVSKSLNAVMKASLDQDKKALEAQKYKTAQARQVKADTRADDLWQMKLDDRAKAEAEKIKLNQLPFTVLTDKVVQQGTPGNEDTIKKLREKFVNKEKARINAKDTFDTSVQKWYEDTYGDASKAIHNINTTLMDPDKKKLMLSSIQANIKEMPEDVREKLRKESGWVAQRQPELQGIVAKDGKGGFSVDPVKMDKMFPITRSTAPVTEAVQTKISRQAYLERAKNKNIDIGAASDRYNLMYPTDKQATFDQLFKVSKYKQDQQNDQKVADALAQELNIGNKDRLSGSAFLDYVKSTSKYKNRGGGKTGVDLETELYSLVKGSDSNSINHIDAWLKTNKPNLDKLNSTEKKRLISKIKTKFEGESAFDPSDYMGGSQIRDALNSLKLK